MYASTPCALVQAAGLAAAGCNRQDLLDSLNILVSGAQAQGPKVCLAGSTQQKQKLFARNDSKVCVLCGISPYASAWTLLSVV